ncbi:COG4315 family predicted lipoprotein [Actinoplanes solisilvae]|uniref:COG4315 family predicted lipoprotein n=1 Tax=Actinoplanes solisilvae TaxID=2486853 RepID=UPI000FDA0140|nr:hypothetical protein [Actinoplanes solisilvae]
MSALGACAGQGEEPAASSDTVIGTATTALGAVLTGAKGHTLYMFSADTPTASNCNDGCADRWPPAKGAARYEGHETLPGKLGTLTRADGSTQITYQGHALYTYSKDSDPRDTKGENVQNQWHVVKTDTPPFTNSASDASTAPGEGAGGYAY